MLCALLVSATNNKNNSGATTKRKPHSITQKSISKYIQWPNDKNIIWKESGISFARKPLYSKYTKHQIMSSKKNNIFLDK